MKKVYIAYPQGMCSVVRLQMHKLHKTLLRAGCQLVTDPTEADVSLVGTCAAFDADEARSTKLVKKNANEKRMLYAYGCLCNANPEALSGARLFKIWEADNLVRDLTDGKSGFDEREILPDEFRDREEYRVYDPGTRFLGITFGCSFNCTYCPHKLGVGEAYSFPFQGVVDRVRELNGNPVVRTIYITGTDTACYHDSGKRFAELLKAILSELRPDIEIRISQFNPEGLFYNPDLLLEQLKDQRITEFQLPIQTASKRLLHIMNRDYDPDRVGDFIMKVRMFNPDIYLRTDLMIGFPTETEEEFQSSIDFAIRHYTEIALYEFELKEKTLLAEMNLTNLPSQDKEMRYRQALEKIKAAGLKVHSGGQKLATLIENDRTKKR